MAYGVICTSILLAAGYPPAVASASVHAAELVTSGISGHFHWRNGNVDPLLFRALLWPGVIGGAIGVVVLTTLPADRLTPWIAAYLAVMGVRILHQAWRTAPRARPGGARLTLLGFVGGLLDAVGGGGWGPLVTSTLVAQGEQPRRAIGSVNRAEFFVTLAQTAVFVTTIGLGHWPVIAALCVGGALAAPLAAVVVRCAHPRTVMAVVGLLILALSARTFGASW